MMKLLCVTLVVVLCSLVDATKVDQLISDDELHAMLDSTDLTDPTAAKQLFHFWKKKYGKIYATKEHEDTALLKIMDNANKVKASREALKSGTSTYELSLNKFADMTFDEFSQTKLGFVKPNHIVKREAPAAFHVQHKRAIPQAVNWVSKGYVTPVKMQGNCGCCWTFATTGAIEGQYFKKFGQLKSFSPMELVECVEEYAGCNGGDYTTAFDFIAKSSGGLAIEANYPYIAQDGLTYGACKMKTILQVKMNLTYTIMNNNDQDLLNALSTVGPIVAAVSVADPFMLYTSGVMDPVINCGVPSDVNHAVLIVGYGVDSLTGLSYWLVKNSWDLDWGENGYFRLMRNTPNSCGIAEYAVRMTLV